MSDKVAVITGANGGLGRALREAAQAHGYRVVAIQRCGEASDRTINADFGDGQQAIDLISRRLEEECPDGLDLLINNAGIATLSPVALMSYGEVRDIFEVNCIAPLVLIGVLWDALARRRGRILNIGSMSSRIALPLLGAYAASKSSLLSITDVCRLEGGPFGIQAGYIELGNVKTGLHRKVVANAQTKITNAELQFNEWIKLGLSVASDNERLSMSASWAAQKIFDRCIVNQVPRVSVIGSDARVRYWINALLPRSIVERWLISLIFPRRMRKERNCGE